MLYVCIGWLLNPKNAGFCLLNITHYLFFKVFHNGRFFTVLLGYIFVLHNYLVCSLSPYSWKIFLAKDSFYLFSQFSWKYYYPHLLLFSFNCTYDNIYCDWMFTFWKIRRLGIKIYFFKNHIHIFCSCFSISVYFISLGFIFKLTFFQDYNFLTPPSNLIRRRKNYKIFKIKW